MVKIQDVWLKNLFLFAVGGDIYLLLELLFRGTSHWSMYVLGGICFLLIGYINRFLPWETPLPLQMLLGCILITVLEFFTGLLVNCWLGWNVWDYSEQWGNLLGQICPLFSVLWFFLSSLAIVLDDYMRFWLFGEERPRYQAL